MQTEGVINVLKPPGMTSSDVVSDLRHIFNMKRVGHTGTLDPGAAGVLPVCLGRATRLFDYLVDKRKEYIAELRVGMDTDTQDAYGEVTSSSAAIDEKDIQRVLPQFIGSQRQRAPLYSAVRLNGRQLYKFARSGQEVDESALKVRDIEIYALELIGTTAPDRFLLKIECGKGTYVRTLCQDIAHAAGGCGHMSFLLRSRSGDFDIENAYTMAELRELKENGGLKEAPISMEAALHKLYEVRLSLNAKDARKLQNGAPVEGDWLAGLPVGEPLRVYCNGEFTGIGLAGSEGLHISVFLKEEHED